MRSIETAGPRLAIWGTFDVANFGDHLFPRIFESEMKRRLPTAQVQAFSPLGYLHPLPLDEGLLVEPLGEWSPERLVELADSSDLVAIGGGEIIHTQENLYADYYDTSVEEVRRLQPSKFFIEGLGTTLEESYPVAWHSVGIPFDLDPATAVRVRSALEKRAYVSVRDNVSRERLLHAGVTREVTVVPDSAFLLDRIVTDEVVERRLAYLRGIESYPASERPLVVQGNRALLAHVEDIGRALSTAAEEVGGVPVVLLEASQCHGDKDFADAVAPYLGSHVYRMPASPLVADIVAAIVNSRGFVGISLRGHVTAFVRGLPSAILDLGNDYSKLTGFAELVRSEDTLVRTSADLLPAIRQVLSGKHPWDGLAEIANRVDAHFDALAELAERSASERSRRDPAGKVLLADMRESESSLARAFEARGRRLVEQRLRLGDEIERLEQELRALGHQLETKEESLEAERLRHASEIERLTREAEESLEALRRVEAEASRLTAEHERTAAEAERTVAELKRLRNSRSVRYTAPIRSAFDWLHRLVR